jgi:hypothetical protein
MNTFTVVSKDNSLAALTRGTNIGDFAVRLADIIREMYKRHHTKVAPNYIEAVCKIAVSDIWFDAVIRLGSPDRTHLWTEACGFKKHLYARLFGSPNWHMELPDDIIDCMKQCCIFSFVSPYSQEYLTRKDKGGGITRQATAVPQRKLSRFEVSLSSTCGGASPWVR